MIEHKEGLVQVAICGLYEAKEIDGLQAQLRRAKREAKAWRRTQPEPGFVQVVFVGDVHDRRYTYRDSRQACLLGDIVEVPSGSSGNIELAKVVSLEGSGTPELRSRIRKEVASILHRTVIA